jgi:hypothetical protein
MLDRYHTTSIGPAEVALRAAFLKCGDLMKARMHRHGLGRSHQE